MGVATSIGQLRQFVGRLARGKYTRRDFQPRADREGGTLSLRMLLLVLHVDRHMQKAQLVQL